MASSLANLVNNLSERINKNKFKCKHDDKNCKTCRKHAELNTKFATVFLNTKSLKMI